jgi:hypothetical protein
LVEEFETVSTQSEVAGVLDEWIAGSMYLKALLFRKADRYPRDACLRPRSGSAPADRQANQRFALRPSTTPIFIDPRCEENIVHEPLLLILT